MGTDYYMTREVELEKHRALCEANGEAHVPLLEVFRGMAAGDEDLFSAMWSFYNFAHAFDDLIDESGFAPDEVEAAMANLHDAVVYCLLLEGPGYDMEEWLPTLMLRAGWDYDRSNRGMKAWFAFVEQLHGNKLVRKHPAEFRGILVQAMCRCLDGDAMARSADPKRRQLAPAVRCGDVDALFHMVYLARGWTALRVVGLLRCYDTGDETLNAEHLTSNIEQGKAGG